MYLQLQYIHTVVSCWGSDTLTLVSGLMSSYLISKLYWHLSKGLTTPRIVCLDRAGISPSYLSNTSTPTEYTYIIHVKVSVVLSISGPSHTLPCVSVIDLALIFYIFFIVLSGRVGVYPTLNSLYLLILTWWYLLICRVALYLLIYR